MEFIQIAGVVFAVFALLMVYSKFKRKQLSVRWLLVWCVLWIALMIVAVLPWTTTAIAGWVGISTGINLVVYSSIILLFYLVFRIYIKLEDTRKQITSLVREIALQQRGKKK